MKVWSHGLAIGMKGVENRPADRFHLSRRIHLSRNCPDPMRGTGVLHEAPHH